MDAVHTERKGVERAVWDGIEVGYSAGSERRAREAAARIAQARRWLKETLGLAPPTRILVLDADGWRDHATFPVYGMPHYSDERTLVIAAGPAPFLRGVAATVVEHAAPEDRARFAAVYGDPPDPMRFFDLLAVHELGHLYQFARGISFAQGWLMELSCNVILHGYVATHEPDVIPLLTTLPDIGARRPHSHMRNTRLADMHGGVDLDPDNYGWFQMNLHALAHRLWDEEGADGLARLERHLGAGQPIDAASLGAVSATLAAFHREWPAWRAA